MAIDEARERAREHHRAGTRRPAGAEPKGETFGDVAANWLKRHVAAKGLRSRPEIERLLPSTSCRHGATASSSQSGASDVAALLDEVEDDHGARQADYVLEHRARHHELVRRPARRLQPADRARHAAAEPHAQARARFSSDDEIRAIWKAAESGGAIRRHRPAGAAHGAAPHKITTMRWADISVDGEWTIPKEPREKDTAGTLVLPEAALAIIQAQDRIGENPYVFAGRGGTRQRVLARARRRLDEAASGVPAWRIHDLRRTARILMCRAGVRPDIAERVMGHAIGGVEGVYDRHAYTDEKADALQRLAALIDAIVHPRERTCCR